MFDIQASEDNKKINYIYIKDYFSKRYILTMIKEEELLQDVVAMIKQYGQKYSYFVPIITATTAQQFLQHLMALKQVIRKGQKLLQNRFIYYQQKNVCFFIDKKFRQIKEWNVIDIKNLIPMLKFLYESIQFQLEYQIYHEKCKDPLDAYSLMDLTQSIKQTSKKLRKQFLTASMDALYGQNPDKNSYSYKCVQRMNEQQRQKFQIQTIIIFNKYHKKELDETKNDLIFDKFTKTSSNDIFKLLLNLKSDKMDELRNQILELKLIQNEQKWALDGECKASKDLLSSQNLIHCLVTSSYIYRHLAQNFVIFQQNIIFKFDIEEIMLNANQEDSIFNRKVAFNSSVNQGQIKEDFQSILSLVFSIIQGLENKKQMLKFIDGKLVCLQPELVINFCLKMLTYPFRAHYTYSLQDSNFWDNDLEIQFQLNIEKVGTAFAFIIRWLLDQNTTVSSNTINTLCEVIRWANSSKKHEGIFNKVFSNQDKQKDLNPEFNKLIIKFLKSHENKRWPYHAGVWLIKYFSLRQNLKQLLREDYALVCNSIHSFVIQHNRSLDVQNYQLGNYNHRSKHKLQFYKLLEELLKKNPDYSKIVFQQWINELQFFQTDKNDWQTNRRYRIAIMAIIFNNQNFPVTQQIKQRLKKLLLIGDFQRFPIKDEYKYIWQTFLKKIDFDSNAELEVALQQALKQSYDHNIMSNNVEKFYYRQGKPECMKSFIQSITRLLFIFRAGKYEFTEGQALKICDIIFNLAVIQSTFRERLQLLSQQYSIEELERLSDIEENNFRSWTGETFVEYFQHIRTPFINQIPSPIINNAILIKLGSYLKFIMENPSNKRLVSNLLSALVDIIRKKSEVHETELFPQFYNYHRQTIIDILEILFKSNNLTFEADSGSNQKNEIMFTLNVKKGQGNTKQQWNKKYLNYLEENIKNFIKELFSNSSWEKNIILNSTKYSNVNNLRVFEKTVQSDLAIRLTKRFIPEKLGIYHRIFKIIDDAYHRRSKEELQCSRLTLKIQPPEQPIAVIEKLADLEIFNQSYKDLIKKLFQYQDCFEASDSDSFQEVFNLLSGELPQQQKVKVKKDILQRLVVSLRALLTSTQFSWLKFESIHGHINSVLCSFEESLETLLSKQFIEQYFNKISQLTSKNQFEIHSPQPFVNFIQKLVPNSKPQIEDFHFNKYSKYSALVCTQLIRKLKVKDVEQIIESLTAKIIHFEDPFFDQYIVLLMKKLQGVKDTYSQLFCELIEKRLRTVSIELQLKSLFLNIFERSDGNAEENQIKLSEFANTFSKKYRYCKAEFVKVVQALTIKKSVKSQNHNTVYLKLNPNESFQFSSQIGKKFVDVSCDPIIRTILSSLITSFNVEYKDQFQLKLRQISIITYNFPILVSYILMHPKKCKEKEVPFIDYLFNAFTENIFDENLYSFLGSYFIDVCLIIKFEERCIFFSEYLCYRLMQKIIDRPITNGILVFIFYMIKIKRFSDLCFKKMNEKKSVVDLLWEHLLSLRQNFAFKSHHCFLLYHILAILYRESCTELIFNHCYYKKQGDQWEEYNRIVNSSCIPFGNLILKNSQKQDQVFKVLKNCQFVNIHVYKHFESLFQDWYKSQPQKEEEISLSKIDSLCMNEIVLNNERIKHLGVSAKTHGQHYQDINSQTSKSFFQIHCSSFEVFHLYYLDHPDENNTIRKRRRWKECSYQFFPNLHEQDENQAQSSEDEELQNEINVNRQSHFAPEEFVRQRNRKPSGDEESEDFQKELQTRLSEFNEKVSEDHIVEEKEEQFTNQMFDIFSKINDRLSLLQRPLLNVTDVAGKTLQQKLEFLEAKDLQTDFDLKEATMGYQEFQNYCLANVCKLERLGSERRNIVRNIEDTMLLKFVQRSVSSDSVDYIIDTIDQNYQLLPNTLSNRLSTSEGREQINKEKKEKKLKFISSSNIPIENFQDISDEHLYEIILSLYFSCSLNQVNYFTPFMENKKTQQRLINSLLYISKSPFEHKEFPDKIMKFDLQNFKWQELQKNEAAKQMKYRISQIFINGKNNSFYEDQSYLKSKIGFQGVKNITYLPKISQIINQKYSPIYEVLSIILQHDEDADCSVIFNLLKGISDLPDCLIDKFVSLLNQAHLLSVKVTTDQSANIDSSEVSNRIKQYKEYDFNNNLKCILSNQKILEKVKSAFPIDSEGRDAFFVSLLMDLGVYTRQDLLKFHKQIIKKDVENSANVYFSNQAFKLYTDQQLKECFWIKQSKNILPCIIRSLPRNQKMKEQPFYRLCAYPEYLILQFKSQMLYKKVEDYQSEISFKGSEEVVAQRKKGIFQSAFLDLRNKPDGFWYENFSVKFMNQAGTVQSGYGRGVAKDWYAYVTKGMANLNYGIFMKSSKNYYFFNRESWINPRHLQFLEFIGKLFALSIINKEFYLSPSFSILIYKMITGQKIEISDIVKQFDEGEVIKNIQKLRQYHDDSLFCQSFVYQDKRLISNRNLQILRRKRSIQAVETNVKENNLYLLQEAVQLKQQGDEPKNLNEMKEEQIMQLEQQPPKMIKVLKIGESIELVPGGAQIAVNMENREQFIRLTKEKIYDIIVNGVKQQFKAFMAGFNRVIKPDWIKNISAQELRQIAEGCDKISIEDLKKHVTLNRNIQNSPQIEWFWSCMQKLSARDRMYLIQHWTGLPKISAEGFKGTNLTIVKGQYNGRLFAQTCFNKLHLPEFENKEKMEEAITMVINSVKVGESIIQD